MVKIKVGDWVKFEHPSPYIPITVGKVEDIGNTVVLEGQHHGYNPRFVTKITKKEAMLYKLGT